VAQWWDSLRRGASRRSRLLAAGAIVGMGFTVLAYLNRNADPEPTAATSPAAWVMQPMAGGPQITLQFDQESGWTRVTDSRSPEREWFFHDGRALLPVESAAFPEFGAAFLSAPVGSVFPAGMTFDPAELAESLDRGPRECTLPTPAEDQYVKYFLASEIPELVETYSICGRGVFANVSGDSLVFAEDRDAEPFSHPADAEVITVETMGEGGRTLLDALITEMDLAR